MLVIQASPCWLSKILSLKRAAGKVELFRFHLFTSWFDSIKVLLVFAVLSLILNKEVVMVMVEFFHILQARDPQQEAKEELENLKKQHDLLKRMLQQQEQLKALQGRQAALLALQHKAEQAIAVMDDSGMWNDGVFDSMLACYQIMNY